MTAQGADGRWGQERERVILFRTGQAMAGKGADGVDQLLAFNELFTKSAAAFVQVTQEGEKRREDKRLME